MLEKGCLQEENDIDFGLVSKFGILDSTSHRLNDSQNLKNDVGNDWRAISRFRNRFFPSQNSF